MQPRPNAPAAVAVVLFLSITLALAQSIPELEPIPVWFKTLTLHGGVGYKDNVLLSNFAPRQSAYWSSGFDFLLWRLPSRGWQFNFFATGEDLRYVKAVGVDAEEMAMVMAQVSRDFGDGWKAAIPLQYVYMNQVFDLSATEKTNVIGKVLGHNFSLHPSIRKNLGDYWVESEAAGSRQYFAKPLDDYSQASIRVALGRNYGLGSSLSLMYQAARVFYDSRETASRTGVDLAGTSLRMQSHVVELALEHRWDQKKHWSTQTRIGLEKNGDNGPGFYDYLYYRGSQQVSYEASTWKVSAQVKAGYYDYGTETVSASDLSHRRKTGVMLSLHAEKHFGKHFKVFGNLDQERSRSNLAFDNYIANSVSTGMEWEF